MSYPNLKSLSFVAGKRPHRRLLQLVLALAMAMVVPIIASAYTIVLRNGRHKEIPATFTVNGSALTYEWAPGFNITLSLSVIDIPATERINQEPPGSFLRRASASAFPSMPRTNPAPANQATLTITNADLEHSRRVRVASEKAYEQRRRQLGLPSLDETRRLNEQQAQETVAFVRDYTAREGGKEAYWRSRASDLRAEVAEVDSQIYYLRSRITELNQSSEFAGSSLGSYTTVIPDPYGWRGPYYGGQGYPYGYGRDTGTTWPYGYGRDTGTTWPYGTFPNYSSSRQRREYENSYARTRLVEQLDNLLVRRKGLAVRWRLLEDEARRAGAYPGWLRP